MAGPGRSRLDDDPRLRPWRWTEGTRHRSRTPGLPHAPLPPSRVSDGAGARTSRTAAHGAISTGAVGSADS